MDYSCIPLDASNLMAGSSRMLGDEAQERKSDAEGRDAQLSERRE
jgi:hypothetical protein